MPSARETVLLASSICARVDDGPSVRVFAAASAISWVWMVVRSAGLVISISSASSAVLAPVGIPVSVTRWCGVRGLS